MNRSGSLRALIRAWIFLRPGAFVGRAEVKSKGGPLQSLSPSAILRGVEWAATTPHDPSSVRLTICYRLFSRFDATRTGRSPSSADLGSSLGGGKENDSAGGSSKESQGKHEAARTSM